MGTLKIFSIMKIIPWMDPNWGDFANQHAVDTVAKSVLTNCQSVQALMGSAPALTI